MSGFIYQPRGRAGEYAEWACNLYRGCPHGCAYCYVPDVLRRTGITRYEFHRNIAPRKDVLKGIERDVKTIPQRTTVHLCFTCDPYPNIDRLSYANVREMADTHITRRAIEIIKGAGHHVQILTKGGGRNAIVPDLDLLDENDWFGVTLTMDNDDDSRLWEPHASYPHHRIELLDYAASWGIRTWVSLEPVIYPLQSLRILERALGTAPIDLVKVGPLNYVDKLPRWLAQTVPDVDWPAFVDGVKELCTSSTEIYLKQDLVERVPQC